MPRVNIVKQIKIDGRWVLRSIPKKKNGQRDWAALPEGSYFIEWRENGKRMRLPAGHTTAQALESQRIKRAELSAFEVGILARPAPSAAPDEPLVLSALLDRYLDQINTLKKPNTHRKYDAVLTRFAEHFGGRTLDSISIEELNSFVVKLKKQGLSANTVLHNVIIIAQFAKRNGRANLTRELQLPEKVVSLPRQYSDEDLAAFFAASTAWERALFSTFLLTGFREQEVMYLFWSDLNLKLRTVRVTAKPGFGFSPKRSEEREVPVPQQLAQLLESHPRRDGCPFVFPSPAGNREQNMLLRCKDVAERAGLDPAQFDLKTFRSTFATRALRSGFDVRTVQHWMGHKSLETTMRYLVPAQDVHDRLDLAISVPGVAGSAPPKIGPGRETRQREPRRAAVHGGAGVTARN